MCTCVQLELTATQAGAHADAQTKGHVCFFALQVQDSLHGLPRSVGDFFTWGPVERSGPFWAAAEAHAREWPGGTVGW